MTFGRSTSVQARVLDVSGFAQLPPSSIGAVVGAFLRGKVGPNLITRGSQQYLQQYGAGDSSYSKTHLYCRTFLQNGSPAMWINRVVNTDARWAAIAYANDCADRARRQLSKAANIENASLDASGPAKRHG
jgi:hypothetical protein